jgi:parallel beta-helix repeat protein
VAEATFYVAPDGNDAWSGQQPEIGAAAEAGPFATVQRARDALREYRKNNAHHARQPATIFLRGGWYYLNEPLVLLPEDSGSEAAPVTYAAYQAEKPILSGGRTITGWQPIKVDGRPLWYVDVPEVRDGHWNFHQLWVNGQRRPLARSPNDSFYQIESLPDFDPKAPYDNGQNRFVYEPGHLARWRALDQAEVVVLHYWISSRLPIAAVDEESRMVNFATDSKLRMIDRFVDDGAANYGANERLVPARYYVENALELLDLPGEWYLHRSTGRVYYWPLPGEEPSTTTAIAPVLGHLVQLQGAPLQGRPVEHLAFRGLNFVHTEWRLPAGNSGQAQAAVDVPAVIHGEGVRATLFERCTVAHTAMYGLELNKGSRDNRIVACDFFDLGAGGVKIGDQKPGMEGLHTHSNEVSDCLIHDGGKIFHQAVGIWVGESFNNHIHHNEIRDLYYTGISVGWTWGYALNLARGNVIEFNHVHHLGKGWLNDMGGIYTLGVQPGTIIRNNVFHDITVHAYGGWGIYLDQGSSEMLIRDNLAYNVDDGGFDIHFGRDNIVENNVFASGARFQLGRTRPEAHASFVFRRNIVCWDSGELLRGKWSDDAFRMDGNIYWFSGGREFFFGNESWHQWQARGHDVNSHLIDPGFVDHTNGDFRFISSSSVDALGFKPVDWSTVGPRR